jgi:hypothetical protein
MINYVLDLLAGPESQLAFRAAEAEANPAWRQFYWSSDTGFLDLKRLSEDEVAGWAPVRYSSDPLSRPVANALTKVAECRVAIRIPSHADCSPEMAWLGWWVSAAGLTVQLLRETEVLDWTPLYEERESADGDHAE